MIAGMARKPQVIDFLDGKGQLASPRKGGKGVSAKMIDGRAARARYSGKR
jgi:hypothetical protein